MISLRSSRSSCPMLYTMRAPLAPAVRRTASSPCLCCSPMDEYARAHYGVSETVITWWLNLGAAAAVVAFPFTTKYLAGKAGLRQICVWCSFAQAVATFLRLLPEATGQQQQTWSIAVIFIAQFIIGVVGPAVMAAPPLLSAQWFAENERTRATAVSCLSNNFGSAIGFLMGSQVVAAADDVPTVLFIHAGLAALSLIMIVAYLPAAPPSPPSVSARLKNETQCAAGSSAVLGGIGGILGNGNFWLVASSGGVLNGVFNVWSGSFDQILPPLSPQFTQSTCGWLGFGCAMSVILAGLATSQISDRPPWNRRLKLLLVASGVVTLVCMAYVTFALPTIFSATPLLPSNFSAIIALFILASLAIGSGLPLLFEMCAEQTYPVPESTSANIIVLILNLGALVFLGATPGLLRKRVLNVVVLVLAALALAGFALFKPHYVRRESEIRHSVANGMVSAAP